MPEMEMWTYSRIGSAAKSGIRMRRVGVNLGAPGDRRSGDDTLWLEHPRVGGDSPALKVTVEGGDIDYFRRHSSAISGEGLPWVGASGVVGATNITIVPQTTSAADSDETGAGGTKAKPLAPVAYHVRLHFAEPENLPAGGRVFDVALQGEIRIRKLDIRQETGGARRGLVREFRGVQIADALTIGLTKSHPDSAAPVLSGVELIAAE